MKWKIRKTKRKNAFSFNSEKIFLAATQPRKLVYSYFETSSKGLNDDEIESRGKQFGTNEISHERRDKGLVMFIKTFINPFIGILMALALVSIILDVWLAAPDERDWTTAIIIGTMVMIRAFNAEKTFTKSVYAFNNWFKGLYEWIKASNLSPKYLNSYLKNALNAHVHVKIPYSWYQVQKGILEGICNANLHDKVTQKNIKA